MGLRNLLENLIPSKKRNKEEEIELHSSPTKSQRKSFFGFRRKSNKGNEHLSSPMPVRTRPVTYNSTQQETAPVNTQLTDDEPEIEILIGEDKVELSLDEEVKSTTIIIDGTTLEVVFEGKIPDYDLSQEQEESFIKNLLRPVVRTGINVKRVIIAFRHETETTVTYYNQLGQMVREDIVPQMALNAAYRDADIAVQSMRQEGFDNEIVEGLEKKLSERLARHQKD